MQSIRGFWFSNIDWVLVVTLVPILGAGLITMKSFVDPTPFFEHQLIWITLGFIVFFLTAQIDARFFKSTSVLVALFLIFSLMLITLFVLGHVSHGAQSWFSLGGFSFQPSDMMKIVVILMLAKYFSRRHVEIKHIKHIFISGLYALIPFVLVLLQPDFGSALIIFCIWFGMVVVSGISKKHLFLVFGISALTLFGLWNFIFHDYQKERILNFIHPLSDIRGSGYNAYQSTIAVGSGKLLGKGVGLGTQSRLHFLPEYQTDFVFAAFAEEWGFIGALFLLLLYGVLLWRIVRSALSGASNFEVLYCLGVSFLFMSHIIINIGMNIGILPVTGITLPFMSYGGSNIISSFFAIGILMAMRTYSRAAHRDDMKNEFVGY